MLNSLASWIFASWKSVQSELGSLPQVADCRSWTLPCRWRSLLDKRSASWHPPFARPLPCKVRPIIDEVSRLLGKTGASDELGTEQNKIHWRWFCQSLELSWYQNSPRSRGTLYNNLRYRLRQRHTEVHQGPKNCSPSTVRCIMVSLTVFQEALCLHPKVLSKRKHSSCKYSESNP